MPDFEYVARETDGRQVAGTLAAASRHEALGTLAARRLFPVRVEVADRSSTAERIGLSGRIRLVDLVAFYAQLSDLLRSGVPLLRALEILERQSTRPALREVVQSVREQVADGTRLAEALRRHPRVFGELAVSMIRAGEEGGFVEDALARVAAFVEHQHELRSRVVAAMAYPAFLAAAMLFVVAGMLVFLVPRFQPLFDRLEEQGDLPWATTTLMSLSAAVRDHWAVVLAVLGAAGWGVLRWSRTDRGRALLDRLRLRAVGIGPVVRSLALARFCRILGTLLRNGVPILPALRIARDAVGSPVLAEAVSAAADHVSEGGALAEPLRRCGWFPPEIVEMIAVGEESNNLERVLVDIADGMERRTDRRLEVAVRMLEPVMLTFMAAVVLFVVLALLLPILQSSSLV